MEKDRTNEIKLCDCKPHMRVSCSSSENRLGLWQSRVALKDAALIDENFVASKKNRISGDNRTFIH